MSRVLVAVAFGLVAVVAGLATARTEPVAHACGSAGPFDFDTFEAEDYVTTYARAIELATGGRAIQDSYTPAGTTEQIDVRYQGLLKGPRSARTSTANTSLGIPPSIYKSIAWIEANWTNASSEVPFGGVGPVIRSFDCGYGVGQVTTGMSNGSGTASARQAVIGTHFLFNIAEGVRILADKWNSAPRFRPIAGQGDPAFVEDWYYAIWSYNGFAFSNHPLNPNLNPLRGGSIPEPPGSPTPTATATATPSISASPTATPGTPTPTPPPPIPVTAYSPIYHCFEKTAPSYQALANGQPKFGYGDYTYQERVYGCMKYPPRRAPVGSPSGAPATIQFWPSQEVSMPDFQNPSVAAAFAPENFVQCETAGFSGGCPNMDFTTNSPPRSTPHPDTTAPVNLALGATYLGAPSLSVETAPGVSISIGSDGVPSRSAFSVRNVGTWIAAFRIRSSDSWIVVRHAGDASGRSLDGGVAVGAETDVVTQQASAGPPVRLRVAQKGYVSNLIVTVTSAAPRGTTTGKVWVEPLFGGGAPVEITVEVVNGSSGPPAPEHKRRAVIPDLRSDPEH